MVARKFVIGGDAISAREVFSILAVVVLVIVGVEHLDWLDLYPEELEIRTIAVCESEMKNDDHTFYAIQQNCTFLQEKGCGGALS